MYGCEATCELKLPYDRCCVERQPTRTRASVLFPRCPTPEGGASIRVATLAPRNCAGRCGLSTCGSRPPRPRKWPGTSSRFSDGPYDVYETPQILPRNVASFIRTVAYETLYTVLGRTTVAGSSPMSVEPTILSRFPQELLPKRVVDIGWRREWGR